MFTALVSVYTELKPAAYLSEFHNSSDSEITPLLKEIFQRAVCFLGQVCLV